MQQGNLCRYTYQQSGEKGNVLATRFSVKVIRFIVTYEICTSDDLASLGWRFDFDCVGVRGRYK